MTYESEYKKLIAHAERFDKWAESQKKLGMAISRPSNEQKNETAK